MDKEVQLADLFKSLVKPRGHIFQYAEVTEITGDTCKIKIDDLELTDVHLKATDNEADDKFVVIPKVGSRVLVGADYGKLTLLWVVKVDDPEKIIYKHDDLTIEIDGGQGKVTINGGELGGLIKIEELINRLNAIEDAHNNFLTEYKTHVHSGVTAGSGSTGVKTPPSSQINVEKTQRDPLEDTKVTH